ncbi:class I SAM-dependent methyltransferase [candidate division KSB1 bacterium]|nr:class I SAM-dependent methyltransferase [candidate division KSB1 bacterium]
MSQVEIIDYYTQTGIENDRLKQGVGRFEYLRTQEIIRRYLSAPGMTILDVGGGPGIYAFWLAEMGAAVHLIDLTPAHLRIAQARAQALKICLKSMLIAEARALPFPANYADLVLLFGPLYHLVERSARLQALQEAQRVVKPAGRVIIAAISRYASVLDGFRSQCFDDPKFEPIVDQDLRDGQHRNPTPGNKYFTEAYFHTPDALRMEIEATGLSCEKMIGVEGPLGIMTALNTWLDQPGQMLEKALKYMRILESEPALLGVSFHFLAIAQKS